MRKITTLLTAIILLTNTIAFAESRTYKSSSGIFDYTSDGVVTAYYGDELVSVPSDIDGMPIRKIGEMMCFDLGISTFFPSVPFSNLVSPSQISRSAILNTI